MEVDKLKTSIEKNLGQTYSITESKLRNPRIKIPNVPHRYSEEELENIIREQNPLVVEQEHFKIVYIKKLREGECVTVYAECSPIFFHNFMFNKKIYMGWERVPVYEDVSVLRCFKCQLYHHKGNDCRSSARMC